MFSFIHPGFWRSTQVADTTIARSRDHGAGYAGLESRISVLSNCQVRLEGTRVTQL
jgi:hypothetical protein